MKGLTYLFCTTIKNKFKQLLKHPSQLIAYIFFIALMGFVVFSSFMAKAEGNLEYRNISELSAIIFGLYLMMFVMSSVKGLTSGASFYSMSDVNLLFPSPISSKTILFYGIIKQMGTSIFVGVFIFFQYAWLSNTYGITFSQIFAIFFGYCFIMFASQLTSMAIYCFSSSDDNKKRIVKYSIYGVVILIIGYVGYPLLSDQSNIIETISTRINSKVLEIVPVAGWLKAAVNGFFNGELLPILLGIFITVLFCILIVYVIIKSRSDYYEDVLQATEISYSAITAQKEGKMADTTIPAKVKVGKTGIDKGWGASAFFYKHLIENRRSRLFILDNVSIIFILVSITFAFFLRDAGIIPVFVFATYMQLFSTALGRWVRELTLPYVYLVPLNPFKKLVMICAENILKTAVEAALLFIPIGIMLGSSPIDVIVCIIARISFGILFISGNILIERILGTLTNKFIILSLYFIILILLAVPGFILGGVVMTLLNISSLTIVIAIAAVWNVLASTLIVFLCKDILNYAELNNK